MADENGLLYRKSRDCKPRIEELTTIQQEVNHRCNIDDDSSAEEEDILIPPCFNDTDGESCESEEGMDNKSLFGGVTITVGVTVLLILTLAVRYLLTGEALNDILCLINFHSLSLNLCPKLLCQLKRYFHNVTNPIVYHYFCASCLEKINDKTKAKVCPNMVYGVLVVCVSAWKFPDCPFTGTTR